MVWHPRINAKDIRSKFTVAMSAEHTPPDIKLP